MQNSFIYKYLTVLSVSLLLLVGGSLSANENKGLLLQKVKLFNAKIHKKKTDPFTTFYPVEVTESGRVFFNIQITSHTQKDIDSIVEAFLFKELHELAY